MFEKPRAAQFEISVDGKPLTGRRSGAVRKPDQDWLRIRPHDRAGFFPISELLHCNASS